MVSNKKLTNRHDRNSQLGLITEELFPSGFRVSQKVLLCVIQSSTWINIETTLLGLIRKTFKECWIE